MTTFFDGKTVTIIAGPGKGQTRTVTSYNANTRVATVNAAWSITNDAPTLEFDFRAEDTTLVPVVSNVVVAVARATIGTRVNANGLIDNVAVNIPRFSYDPVSKVMNGLLIEEPRTNLLTQSGNLAHSDWSLGGGNITIVDSGIQGPIAGGNWWKLSVTSNTFTNGARAVAGAGSSNGMAYSIFVKKGSGGTDGGTFLLRNNTTGNNLVSATVNFDLGIISQAGTGTGTVSMDVWGTDAYRVRVVANNGITNGDIIAVYVAFTGGPGIVGQFVYATGVQLEQFIGGGQEASTYIPTTTASVARNADNLSFPLGTLFTANCTWGVEWIGFPGASGSKGNSRLVGVNGSGAATPLSYNSGPGPVISLGMWDGTTATSIGNPTYTTGTIGRMFSAFNETANSCTCVANGGTVTSGNSAGSYGTTTTVYLGSGFSGAQTLWINGYLRRVWMFPKVLSNTDIVAVSGSNTYSAPPSNLSQYQISADLVTQ